MSEQNFVSERDSETFDLEEHCHHRTSICIHQIRLHGTLHDFTRDYFHFVTSAV